MIYSVISNHDKFPKNVSIFFFLEGEGGDKQHSSSFEQK